MSDDEYFLATDEELENIMGGDIKALRIIRSRPLSDELKKERERMLDIILGWLNTYYIPDVLKRIKDMRDKS